MLSPPPVDRISPYALDSIRAQNKNNLRSVPVISNRPDKIIYTEEQINELSQISFEFLDGSISMEEAVLKLRGGVKFKDISFIVLYIWLWKLQNSHVQGFQLPPQIKLPHHTLTGGQHRPHSYEILPQNQKQSL